MELTTSECSGDLELLRIPVPHFISRNPEAFYSVESRRIVEQYNTAKGIEE